jgi:hypothetical protein
MKPLKPLSLSLILILCLFMAGCPQKTAMEKAAETAKDVAGSTRDVIKAVGEAYASGLITLEQKDRYADLLIKISQGGKEGVAILDTLTVATATPDKWQLLNTVFGEKVVSPFLTLITEIGKLSPNQSAVIQIAIASLRTIILRLSDAFGRRAELEHKFMRIERGDYVNAE